MRDQDTTARGGRIRLGGRLRRVGVAAGVLVACLLVVAWRFASAHPDDSRSAEPPSAGPVACPAQLRSTAAVPAKPQQRALIPGGATHVLLCAYPFAPTDAWSLGRTYDSGRDPGPVAAYLNSLPVAPRANTVCLLNGQPRYQVVFGYSGGRIAVVGQAECAWTRGSAVRYEGDLRKILGYWGLKPVS
jgi:hypothetical protein